MKMIIRPFVVFVLSLLLTGITGKSIAQLNPNFSIGTATEKYAFNSAEVPDALIEMNHPSFSTPAVTLEHTWEASDRPLDGFETVSSTEDRNETTGSHDYHFPAGYRLPNTKYYREKIRQVNSGQIIYSNVIKLQLVSVNWEDRNYVRVHEVLTQGITDWQAVDNLQTGDKLQTTTFLDGTGRVTEKVSRETATPQQNTGVWGDVVQFGTSNYDAYGREARQYLPYTSYNTNEAGKYKTDPPDEQENYYMQNYGETSPFTNITYENSPLNRVLKINAPGTSWANSQGNSSLYQLNDENDHVKIFTIGYESGDYPVVTGEYAPGTLYRTASINENGNYFIQYTNKERQLILTKEQTEVDYSHGLPNLTNGYNGYICVYSVYDEFGLLRYRLQPNAVNYLTGNYWSFTSPDGQKVLNEWCFRYEYDDKGRTILKKAPGAAPLRMLYDKRGRVVYMQDGNQAAKQPAEWMVNLYDDLDRLVITTLYQTDKRTEELQADIDRADMVTAGTISVRDETRGAINLTLLGSPLSPAELNDPHTCTPVKYLFYDTYDFAGVQRFDSRSGNAQAYDPARDPDILPIRASNRTTSFPTGSLVRILGTKAFLASTEYYDEKGNHIQTTGENIKAGTDVTTLQYHWDGRVLSTDTKHTAEERNGIDNLEVITKNVFDRIGRLTSLQKKYGDNGFKTIATYDFDDMGRLKTKHLDPDYTGNDGNGGTGMESLTYSYNIHNNITGINKDYALKTKYAYDKWRYFFGLYLGYDNKDHVFANAQLDGHVTGQLWNTQGDDAQRKYDYGYDFAGRLAGAAFTEKNTSDSYWNNAKMDFSTKESYDLNGNLKVMAQWGIIPGSAPVITDKLQYAYASYSNKLQKVSDNTAQVSTNGMQGDFKGSQNAVDYDYDDNGNIITDRNKGANKLPEEADGRGISYNFLDKPEKIHIEGKGTIQFVYDADGNKLQKIFTPEGENNTPVTTTYINEFVYKNDDLQYINFEEGRIRMIKPVSTSNGYDALSIGGGMSLGGEKIGVYDYFIRDYQNNVRMIVTEEEHYGSNKCTMETSRAGDEEPIFGQVDANGQSTANNEVKTTRFAVSSIPGQTSGGGWQNESIQSNVSRVGALAASKTGPNVLLKVMAGDVLNATTQYYYQNAVTNTAGNNLTMPVLTSLISAITESPATSALVKGSTGGIQQQLRDNDAFSAITAPDVSDATTDYPKAYLTVLFFDERFNYVSESSATYRVKPEDMGSNNATLTFDEPAKAPKNGYAFVYVSNESDEPVYFDNLNVSDTRGRLVEEDHYYPFGLKIAAISSQKLGDPNEGMLENKNLFNDKELADEADLDWYDYGFRSYDAQIGRFVQLDPLTDDYPYYTPYQYAGNEPVANVDMDGLEELNALTGVTVTSFKSTSTVLTSATASTSATLLEQGGKLTLKATQTAAEKAGETILQQVLKSGIKWTLSQGLETVGLTAVLTVLPLEAGHANPKPNGAPPPGMIWAGNKYIPAPTLEQAPENTPSPFKPGNEDDDNQIFFVTYTKQKVSSDGTITTYSGRTSGMYKGSSPTYEDAQRAIKRRDANHSDLKEAGYATGQLDKYSTDYTAIRGREQQLIDFHGGAIKEGGASGNPYRGVGRRNKLKTIYNNSSTIKWGKLPNNNPADK